MTLDEARLVIAQVGLSLLILAYEKEQQINSPRIVARRCRQQSTDAIVRVLFDRLHRYRRRRYELAGELMAAWFMYFGDQPKSARDVCGEFIPPGSHWLSRGYGKWDSSEWVGLLRALYPVAGGIVPGGGRMYIRDDRLKMYLLAIFRQTGRVGKYRLERLGDGTGLWRVVQRVAPEVDDAVLSALELSL